MRAGGHGGAGLGLDGLAWQIFRSRGCADVKPYADDDHPTAVVSGHAPSSSVGQSSPDFPDTAGFDDDDSRVLASGSVECRSFRREAD